MRRNQPRPPSPAPPPSAASLAVRITPSATSLTGAPAQPLQPRRCLRLPPPCFLIAAVVRWVAAAVGRTGEGEGRSRRRRGGRRWSRPHISCRPPHARHAHVLLLLIPHYGAHNVFEVIEYIQFLQEEKNEVCSVQA